MSTGHWVQTVRTTRSTPKKRSPGRPEVLDQQSRRVILLRAAEAAFTERGYDAATMEQIAQIAGMSKKTLYQAFPDKNNIFTELITELDIFPDARTEAETSHDDPETELHLRLCALAQYILSPRQIMLTRLMISQAGRLPDLPASFHAKVMTKGFTYIFHSTARLTAQSASLPTERTEALTGVLISVLLGDWHLRTLFGSEPPSSTDISVRAQEAIRTAFPPSGTTP